MHRALAVRQVLAKIVEDDRVCYGEEDIMNDFLDGKGCVHEFPEQARAGMDHCAACLVGEVERLRADLEEERRISKSLSAMNRNLEYDLLRAVELRGQAEDAASRAISKMARAGDKWGKAVEGLFNDRFSVTAPDGRFAG